MAAAVLAVAPEYSLSRYLQEIRKFPYLTVEEELILARRWRDEQGPDFADKLVTSHLRLVAKIAMGYRGYGLPVGELIGEGNIGLMRAVKRYDPERGFRFATYAMWWIRAAIQEYILHSWSLVKMGTTGAQKKLFFNLRRLKSQLQAIDEGDLPSEHVAKISRVLGVPEQDVVSMNRRLAAPDHSLNAPVRSDGESEWQDWLVDESESQETSLAEREELNGVRALLPDALNTLNERERRILIERRLKDNPASLEELSQQYGISRERVRQIEVRAFEKLQKAVKLQMVENSILKRGRAAIGDRSSATSKLIPAAEKTTEPKRERADAARPRWFRGAQFPDRQSCVVGTGRPPGPSQPSCPGVQRFPARDSADAI